MPIYAQLMGLRERCKLSQLVRVEPGRWTILAAFWAEKWKSFWWEQFHAHTHEKNTCKFDELTATFSVDGPRGGGRHGQSGPMVNTPLSRIYSGPSLVRWTGQRGSGLSLGRQESKQRT